MSIKNILSRDKRKYVLKSERALGHETHSYLPELCDQLRRGLIDRRDFLRQACLLGLTLTSANFLAACGDKEKEAESGAGGVAGEKKMGGILKCSMQVQEITDPAKYSWTEPSNVSRFIVEYLVRTGSNNITVPYLAQRWEANDKLTEWVFHLNKDIKWSNGDAFGADDVVKTIERWLDPKTGSSNLGLFDALVDTTKDGKKSMRAGSVEKVDDLTVKLNLKQPSLSIPENFYNYPTAITHKGFGRDYEANLEKNPIGTGCFKLEAFAVKEKAILKKTRDWWAGQFALDEIHFYDHGEDTNAWIAAVASGQVDTLYRVPGEMIDAAKQLPNVEVYSAQTAQTVVMRFRVSEKPFNNPKVRQAVVAAMDNAEILAKAYKGLGELGQNYHVAPIHPEHAPLAPLTRDVEKAKKLLAEAGYPKGIELTIANGDTNGSWMTDACTVMKEQVAAAGIKVNINKMPSGQYWEIWDKAPWGYTAWTHRPLGTMVLSLGYRSGVPWNESNYKNPAFDKALDEAEATLDINERKKKIQVCEQLMQDDAIAPIPFWSNEYTVATKKVKGLTQHPTNYFQYQDVWIDEA